MQGTTVIPLAGYFRSFLRPHMRQGSPSLPVSCPSMHRMLRQGCDPRDSEHLSKLSPGEGSRLA